MRARAIAFTAVFVALAFAGCIGPAEVETGSAEPVTTEAPRPRVVVAVIDTGINLFHEEFRRDGAEPPAYLPEGREEIVLDFDHGDWEDAREANDDALMAMEPGVLYTFPGTKVVGAISFLQSRPNDWPVILDRPGVYTHGTMTASRAVGSTVAIGGAEAEIDLVLVQGFNAQAVTWAAEQDWIDLISISAGISPFSILPGLPNVLDNGGIEAYQAAAQKKPFFASSGNGVLNAGLLGFPSWTRGSSGVPDAISVGANDNARTAHWHNFDSYVAADGCGNPAARPDSLDEVGDYGGGTSSATPFSAGGGALMLLEARRLLGDVSVGPTADDALSVEPGAWDSLAPSDATVVLARTTANATPPAKGPLADGVLTLLEFKDVLYHTALPTPTDDPSDGVACVTGGFVPGDSVPEDARFPLQGYGEVNHASVAHAVDVLRGEADPLSRPSADRDYARAHSMKTRVVTGGA